MNFLKNIVNRFNRYRLKNNIENDYDNLNENEYIGLLKDIQIFVDIYIKKKLKPIKNKNNKFLILVKKVNNKKLGNIKIILTQTTIKFIFKYILDLTNELENMDDEQECPVCYEKCNFKLKNCGHTLCRSCCSKILDKCPTKSYFHCPYCRELYILKEYKIVKKM